MSDEHTIFREEIVVDMSGDKQSDLNCVKHKVKKPQDLIPPKTILSVDTDGETVKKIQLDEDYKESYLLLFSFPLGLAEDAEEVLNFSAKIEEFEKLDCTVLGITCENPMAVKRWIKKDHGSGGFGKVLGFPVITDKDLSLCTKLGIANDQGVPARGAFIVGPSGKIRYSQIHGSDIKFCVDELLRLVRAFKASDSTGMDVPAGWNGAEEDLIPRKYAAKMDYFKKKYASKKKVKESDSDPDRKLKEDSDSGKKKDDSDSGKKEEDSDSKKGESNAGKKKNTSDSEGTKKKEVSDASENKEESETSKKKGDDSNSPKKRDDSDSGKAKTKKDS